MDCIAKHWAPKRQFYYCSGLSLRTKKFNFQLTRNGFAFIRIELILSKDKDETLFNSFFSAHIFIVEHFELLRQDDDVGLFEIGAVLLQQLPSGVLKGLVADIL